MDEVRPPGEPSAADVVAFVERDGLKLDPWQRDLITQLYERSADGRYTFDRERVGSWWPPRPRRSVPSEPAPRPSSTRGWSRVWLDEIQ